MQESNNHNNQEEENTYYEKLKKLATELLIYTKTLPQPPTKLSSKNKLTNAIKKLCHEDESSLYNGSISPPNKKGSSDFKKISETLLKKNKTPPKEKE
jgi:hypothetical protein